MSLRAGLILVVLALVVGMRAGVWLAEKEVAERERRVVAEAPRVPAVTPSTLRCTNGDPPRAWTRVETEGRMHTAQMSLRSAEFHGVWTDLGRRWSQLAEAQMAEVRLCWGGEP